MIRCNNCMTAYKSEEDLSLIIEKSEFHDGDWHTTDRFLYDSELELTDTETERYEIFKGCPFCLADEWLMDLSPYQERNFGGLK